MPSPSPNRRPGRSQAFTIIELLTVIAIIGILAAVLIPTLTGSQVSAKRAKTKVQFNQWAVAIEGFRQEYGYYPNFPTNLVNGTTAGDVLFQELLSGRGTGTGTPPSFVSSEDGSTAQNKKRIAFISFGQGDLLDKKLQDAFGKTEIAVLVDKNQDGMIKIAAPSSGGDYTTSDVPLVGGLMPLNKLTTDDQPLNTDGQIVRASVIFYSPGPGQSVADVVKSW